jgi:hypothetical protein
MASVKSNVGHMEAAAFTCALLKVLLMFEHRTYAPVSAHFTAPSPDIDFTGLRVQTESEPFGEGQVTVGINSFGFGGANGHCLLTEYRPDRAPAWSRPPAADAAYLVPLSARTPEALAQTAAELRDLITGEPLTNGTAPDLDLYTLAGNLSRRRTHFAARAAFAATSLPQLAERLDAFASDPSPAGLAPEGTGAPRILMVFAGQGTQWAGCGRALYDTEPVFRRAVDAVDAAWRGQAGFSLRDACFTASQEDLDEVQLAQPAIFLIEVALAELLKTWGVYPDGVIGTARARSPRPTRPGSARWRRRPAWSSTAPSSSSAPRVPAGCWRSAWTGPAPRSSSPSWATRTWRSSARTPRPARSSAARARPWPPPLTCSSRAVSRIACSAATSPSAPAPWTSSRRTCAPRSPSSTVAGPAPRSRSSPA